MSVPPQGPCLEEFSNSLRAAIARLGGAAFPKMNWTAPKVNYS